MSLYNLIFCVLISLYVLHLDLPTQICFISLCLIVIGGIKKWTTMYY